MLRITTVSTSAKLAEAQRCINGSRLKEAETLCRQVLAADPQHPDALHLMGLIALYTNHLEDAEKLINQAIAGTPNNAKMRVSLGEVYLAQDRMDDLLACCRKVVEQTPQDPEAHYNLGFALGAAGLLDERIASYERAVALRSSFHTAHSSLLYTLYFRPESTAQSIFERHRRWNTQIAQPLLPAAGPANDRNPDRLLRIGYVSPDLRENVIGRFIAPLFAGYDRTQFELFSYSDARNPDARSGMLRSFATTWRDTAGMLNEQLAAQIRQDKIDILVDLSMHLLNNRLLTFARRPAPVQMTYLAYGGTTGLSTVDYRISDPYIDPPEGGDDQYYSEKTVRIPSYWCYESPVPAASLPPARAQRDGITFGSLNHFAKLSLPALETWAAILNAVPQSHLLLYAARGNHRARIHQFFEARQIAAARIEFVDFGPMEQYLAVYQNIDIALDPFPYAGGTTTCDALFMGVPVVTLRGKTAVGRGGVSILSQLGLTELIADSPEDYIKNAVALAKDKPRLADLRGTLRSRMQRSPLMDAGAFVRSMEQTYRSVWRTYCAASTP